MVLLGNIQEVISSQFPPQSRIPHAALLFCSGNPSPSRRLDHMLQIPCERERKRNSNSGNMCELHLEKAVKKKEHVGTCCLAVFGNAGTPNMLRWAQASLPDAETPAATGDPSRTRVRPLAASWVQCWVSPAKRSRRTGQLSPVQSPAYGVMS